jgi:hypothetical protein
MEEIVAYQAKKSKKKNSKQYQRYCGICISGCYKNSLNFCYPSYLSIGQDKILL